jgi:ketosteroid isomerase-like protein
MSQENVELAHRAYDAVNRRDLDGFLALMDDEVKAVSFLVAMEGEYQGHAGIRRWWQNLLDVFPTSMPRLSMCATLEETRCS